MPMNLRCEPLSEDPGHMLSRFASSLCDHGAGVVRSFSIRARSAMNTYQNLSELQALIGSTLGTSDWLHIDQSRIDQFAAVTGDDQWIHVDPVRAAAGPFRSTVAHGHLTLSLLPVMVRSAFTVADVRMTINYGLNRVRFPAPVPVGSRLRGHFKLLTFEPIAGGAQVVVEVTSEREGHSKPVCVAESVARHYVRA
jgi:acyl dehydratase